MRVNLGKGAFSPSDNLLAFEQYDYGVVLVDTATGSVLGELEQPNEILSDVEFSPDGAFLLGAPWGGTTLYVWDVASRKIVRRVNVRNYVERLTYSGSGNNYILGRSFGTTSLLDLGSGSSIDLGVSSAGGEVVLAGGNIVLSDGEYSSRFVEIKPGQSDPLATYDARVGYGSSQTKALAVGLANNKDEFLTVTYVATDGELTLARFGGPEKTRLFYRVYEEVNRSAIIPGTRAELSNDKRYLAVEHRGLPTVIWDLQSGAPATRLNAIDITKWREGFVGIEYEKDGSRNVVHWSGREGIVVETLPIRLTHTPTRYSMSPLAGIEPFISRSLGRSSNSEQGTEGVERIEAPVKTERELVEIGLQMLCTDTMVDAAKPIFEVAGDQVDHRQKLFGHLGVATFSNRVVIESPRLQAAIAAPIVGDDPRTRHNGALNEAAQRCFAAVGGDGQSQAPGITAILAFVLRFTVPDRGSEKPTPFRRPGSAAVAARLGAWRVTNEAATRFGTVSTISYGRRNTGTRCSAEMSACVVGN